MCLTQPVRLGGSSGFSSWDLMAWVAGVRWPKIFAKSPSPKLKAPLEMLASPHKSYSKSERNEAGARCSLLLDILCLPLMKNGPGP